MTSEQATDRSAGQATARRPGRLRIAMSSYYLPSESKIGAGYQAHGLAQALVDAGHDVTMFSPSAKPDDARYRHELVEVHKPLATFRWAFALRRVDLSGFDVFHAAGDDYWFMGKKRPVHVRTMMGSCMSEAVHIRGTKERIRMFVLGLGEILATFVADRTVLISANTRRWFPWVTTVIPCGVDTSVFHPAEAGGKEPVPTILFVGTYGQRKRGKLLMDVFSNEIRPAVPDATLWMVSSDAPSAPGVEVLGRLSDAELADRYRRAWVFCLPSTYEGFGVPYIEALASGTPVVATPNAGAVEVLDNGRHGRVVSDSRLGTELISLLTDDDARKALAAAGSKRASRFAWQQVVAEYEQVYRDLGATSTSGPRTETPSHRPTQQVDPEVRKGVPTVRLLVRRLGRRAPRVHRYRHTRRRHDRRRRGERRPDRDPCGLPRWAA